MDRNWRAGNMACAEARPLLSDLLDLRRGEAAGPDLSPLGDAGMRAAVEMHVAACPACRAAFEELAELGAAYAEFRVSERPVQDFAGYGNVVRQRMARSGFSSGWRRPSPPKRGQWFTAILSGAAAALVVSLWIGLPRRVETAGPVALDLSDAPPVVAPERPADASAEIKDIQIPRRNPETVALERAEAKAGSFLPFIPEPKTKPRPSWKPLGSPAELRTLEANKGATAFSLMYQNGPRVISRALAYDPAQNGEEVLKQLENELSRFGSLTFAEPVENDVDARGSLGLILHVPAPDAMPQGAPEGLLVGGVQRGSPAERAGLHRGFVLTSLNDLRFSGSTTAEAIRFLNALGQCPKGETIQIDFIAPAGEHRILKRGLTVLGEWE